MDFICLKRVLFPESPAPSNNNLFTCVCMSRAFSKGSKQTCISAWSCACISLSKFLERSLHKKSIHFCSILGKSRKTKREQVSENRLGLLGSIGLCLLLSREFRRSAQPHDERKKGIKSTGDFTIHVAQKLHARNKSKAFCSFCSNSLLGFCHFWLKFPKVCFNLSQK